ncbi:hypothetical protein ATH84_1001295 [Paracoccus versutus]|uniref:Uncharacterized protein n=1 Tax=Paracoccus versutus TaxID=34007 RepID=A0AAQ0HML4_PARVE|nr:hypothetical protein ATH84_1001295 [Paracoccus versutus]
MTAAVGLPAAAFGGDAYRDARLQVATASLNDAAQRRSAAEAAPAATGSPIQGEPPRWTRPQRPRQAHPGPAPGNATSGRNAARQAAGFATIPTGCSPWARKAAARSMSRSRWHDAARTGASRCWKPAWPRPGRPGTPNASPASRPPCRTPAAWPPRQGRPRISPVPMPRTGGWPAAPRSRRGAALSKMRPKHGLARYRRLTWADPKITSTRAFPSGSDARAGQGPPPARGKGCKARGRRGISGDP